MRKTLCGLLGVFVLVSVPSAAHAAFPGLNGKIAYYTQQGTSDDIWVMQPDGSGNGPITGVSMDERDPTWSPDGSRIAFQGSGSNYDIWVMDADGTDMVNLTNTSSQEASPTWSPDGSKIAFVSTRTGDLGSKIYVMDADGTDVVRITNLDFVADNQPAWSSDNHIAFVRQSHIFRMNADGSNIVQVTGSGTSDYDPTWSPSSDRIAYTRSGSSPATAGVHTINADGTNDVDLTAALTEAHDPAWSPDGAKLGVSRNGHVWTMNVNGTGATQLTTVIGTNGDPDWQPLPYPGYARPKGATPIRVPLVPAHVQCSTPDYTHGAPLAAPSCDPEQTSPNLTLGTPDAGGGAANSVGSLLITAKTGVPGPPDDSGAPFQLSLTDVRCNAELPVCADANASGGPDYIGELQVAVEVRMSDKFNGAGNAEPGTVQDFTFSYGTSACAATASTAIGSSCTFNTDVLYEIPGIAKDGKRQIWELGQVRVRDGGPDGDAGTADNSLFAVQGIFVP
jgi:hypothetical protein